MRYTIYRRFFTKIVIFFTFLYFLCYNHFGDIMDIPIKVKEKLDKMYEAYDSPNYVVDYKGQYLLKKSGIFSTRHYHHIDRDRSNNELWNLVPLSYDDHIIQVHTKNNPKVKHDIYDFMVERFPEHEAHYRKYLLIDKQVGKMI